MPLTSEDMGLSKVISAVSGRHLSGEAHYLWVPKTGLASRDLLICGRDRRAGRVVELGQCHSAVSRRNRSQASIACARARRNCIQVARTAVVRVDPGGVEDLPYGGCADLGAETCELAVHAPVSPSGVLGGQTHRQCRQSGRDG